MEKINWDAELKKIEREFDGLPPESAKTPTVGHASPPPAKSAKQQRSAVLGVWARLLLAGVLAGAISYWPYARSCGFGLYAYMGASGAIVIGGLWASIHGWRMRMALVHALALGVMLWGTILIAAEVLPRVGYARVDPNNPPGWQCRVSPPRA